MWLDCDVLQADGGTRTAAISGAWIALARAAQKHGLAAPDTRSRRCPSGSSRDRRLLDLDYSEDSSAEVDMNVVMTGDGRLIEVQATAEAQRVHASQLDALISLAAGGIEQITAKQQEAVS